MTVVSILRRARPLLAGSAILIVLCAGTDVMHAAQRKPLPAFQLLAADGRATTSQALSDDEQWLIVYVTSACPACDRLLDAIAERQSPLAIPRAVVIVGGDPATLMPYIAGRRDAAPSMRFYADVQQQAALVLGLSGAPAVVGIRRGQIEWAISGVLNDPAALEPAITAWLTY